MAIGATCRKPPSDDEKYVRGGGRAGSEEEGEVAPTVYIPYPSQLFWRAERAQVVSPKNQYVEFLYEAVISVLGGWVGV
jgi:hypothetical protein